MPLDVGGGRQVEAVPPGDVTARSQDESALRQAHDELERANTRLLAQIREREQTGAVRSELLRRLSTTQEDERAQIARDLHDSVGQSLTALSLAIKAVADSGVLPPSLAATLARVQQIVDTLTCEVRDIAVRLRPTTLDDFGLASALAQLVAGWKSRTGVHAECQTVGLGALRLSSALETTVYRVVQEALEYIARFTHARFARVEATCVDGCVSVLIEDDRAGLDPRAMASARLNVLCMRERAVQVGGELEIESSPGVGTTILLRIPLTADGGREE